MTRDTASRRFSIIGLLVLVLVVALVLATPGLGARKTALFLAVSGALAFALCVAMLMSDIELLEREGASPERLPRR